MADDEVLKARVQELADKVWDVPAIEDRLKKLAREGIPRKTLPADEILANKQQVLERVQRRAEEYEYLSHN